MKNKVSCIMLIDDNPDDNFFHKRVILKNNAADTVLIMQSAEKALAYLRSPEEQQPQPQIIFLDINMPGMNGWEFLEEYNKIEHAHQVIIAMLTTSDNPDDKKRAQKVDRVSEFKSKPLSKEMLESILEKYFSSLSGF
jgi:CheY-like chemotaxis protein